MDVQGMKQGLIYERKRYGDKGKMISSMLSSKKSNSRDNIEKTRKRKEKGLYQLHCEVEYRTFTPLVFSLTGGKSPEASMFHKHKM